MSTRTALRARVAVVSAAGALAALVSIAATSDASDVPKVALIAAGVVVGELLVLRLEDGTCLPLAYALALVAVRGVGLPNALMAVAIGEAIAIAVRTAPRSLGHRALESLHHGAVASAAIGVAALVDRTESAERLSDVLVVLGAATLAMIVAEELVRLVTGRRSSLTPRGTRAWLVLAACGALMALGAHGVNGRGDFGVWGPLLFSIPLLATWWSFERLDAVSRAQRQTLEALAMAPELAGFVASGHAARVATLCRAMANDVGLGPDAMRDLEAAALLHHLGAVTIPRADEGVRSLDVVRTTAALLRPIASLHEAGAIVGADAEPPRWDTAGQSSRTTSAQILRLASRFDDLTLGDPRRTEAALDALISEPTVLVDLRVLEALERCVARPRSRPARGRREHVVSRQID
jgi:hypothetical protein